ncbi:single-stranded-DNA-specific exonuclease RecJ [Lentibacillus saliphilus]|uniref:single-stranded-DNA-specific exonuclease RecJ n=1 Tax=Lentibacillus saliphilus TaxID=2737028 RepID=UPI001C30F4C7|nr:single-stranded-DNA-specific exonuclease RecJ [Lentibacillus saliphilus]
MLQSKAKWMTFDRKADCEHLQELSHTMSPVIIDLLVQRGITRAEQAEAFLSPKLSNLFAPTLLRDVEKAVHRVQQAVTNREKILVFGDYDADGVSSTTLMLDVLRELGAECDYYIPNRFTEGYGPNKAAFTYAQEQGFGLIITVDTGIASVEETTYANEIGLDIIITDHHEIQDVVPNAYAVVHPKHSPDYPFKELAGVGVAFKFAEALLGYCPTHLLDLVGLGTIADMVPLLNENRILAYYGLERLQSTERPGLKALKKVYKIEGHVTEESVGFQLAPALNAVGRLQSADLAVELLLTEDETEAMSLAKEIEALNEQRKSIVKQIVAEAEQMVQSDEKSAIVVAHKAWNPGVLGIVASRLVRQFNRPAIVLAIDEKEQVAKGSARSIPAFDIFKNGMMIRDVFTHFGGHAQAAGMTLPVDHISLLRDKLSEQLQDQLSEDDFKPVIEVSGTLALADVNEKLVYDLKKLAPFGMKNPKPLFRVEHMPSDVRQIGNTKRHLKMQFQSSEGRIDAIGFGMGSLYPHISQRTPVSIIGELGLNEWNGHRKVQIVLEDMKIDQWQLFDHRGKTLKHVYDQLTNMGQVGMICNAPTHQYANAVEILYNESTDHIDMNIDTLMIVDLPPNLEALGQMIRRLKPQNIHVCYNVQDSVYLKPFPSREDFKWFYGLIYKRNIVDLHKELRPIMAAKSWPKDYIIFMAQVFRELEFIHINKGIIKMNPQPIKKDLHESTLYNERLVRCDVEKTLYYSQYDQLRAWFAESMEDVQSTREAVTDGLQKAY